jgi:hypothetical protein
MPTTRFIKLEKIEFTEKGASRKIARMKVTFGLQDVSWKSSEINGCPSGQLNIISKCASETAKELTPVPSTWL